MDLLNSSEILRTYWPLPILAMVFTFTGNAWINYLYPKAFLRDSLSFPEQIPQRAKWRKPLLFFSLILCFGKAWSLSSMPALFYILVAISFLLFMTVTDFEQQIIINEMVYFFALFGLCYTLHLQLPLTEHLIASISAGSLFLFLAFISRGALGGGDIKLIAALGLWLGIKALLAVIFYGAIAGGIVALLLLLSKKYHRKQYLAYGPYFALSGIGVLLKWLHIIF